MPQRSERNQYLIIPAIGASSNLDPVCQAVCTTQEISTKFGDVIGSGVIQANDEQGTVDNLQTGAIVFAAGKIVTVVRPYLPVFSGEDTYRIAGNLFRDRVNFLFAICQSTGLTSLGGVSLASVTMAWRFRRISLSVRTGRLSPSSTSNQSRRGVRPR